MTDYTFHRGIPVPVIKPGDTPIYDAVVLDHALNDEEGRGLVAAIHERQRQRLLIQDRIESQVESAFHQANQRHPLAALFPFAAGLLK